MIMDGIQRLVLHLRCSKISALVLEDDRLKFSFFDDLGIDLFDYEQNCCEKRYLHTDDDLQYYEGSELLNVEIKSIQVLNNCEDFHEVKFMHVTTSKGTFVIEAHNVHNGHYTGFGICVEVY